MTLRKITFALMTVLILSGSVLAQETASKKAPSPARSSKEDDIQKLLELVGANKLGEQIWKQLLPIMKQGAPSVPEAEWREIDREFGAELSSGRLGQIVGSIYSAHFTQDEVKQLIGFYESPIGKKVVSELPGITQESLTLGQQLGIEIVKRAYEKLRKKGYSVPVA